jgi:SAM-dependent methyltransferase
MRNRWLDVPAADYEGHMNSPEVDQLSVLGRLLGADLEGFHPRELLLLGCATGNGLSQVDPGVTRRVVAVDINPEYLGELRRRYPDPGFDLQVDCADVMTYAFADEAFDMAYCALLLEYVDWPRLLPALSRTIRRAGVLGVVLQRPSDTHPVVTPTRFASLGRLEPIFRFVEPAALADRARECGLVLESQRTQPLESGKAFAVLYFRKAGT